MAELLLLLFLILFLLFSCQKSIRYSFPSGDSRHDPSLAVRNDGLDVPRIPDYASLKGYELLPPVCESWPFGKACLSVLAHLSNAIDEFVDADLSLFALVHFQSYLFLSNPLWFAVFLARSLSGR
jgi:hypothetical protein